MGKAKVKDPCTKDRKILRAVRLTMGDMIEIEARKTGELNAGERYMKQTMERLGKKFGGEDEKK